MIQELEVILPSKAVEVESMEEDEETLAEEDLESEAETVDAEVEVEQRPDLRTGFLSACMLVPGLARDSIVRDVLTELWWT